MFDLILFILGSFKNSNDLYLSISIYCHTPSRTFSRTCLTFCQIPPQTGNKLPLRVLKNPHRLIKGEMMWPLKALFFSTDLPLSFNNSYTISHEFELRPDFTSDSRVNCP